MALPCFMPRLVLTVKCQFGPAGVVTKFIKTLTFAALQEGAGPFADRGSLQASQFSSIAGTELGNATSHTYAK